MAEATPGQIITPGGDSSEPPKEQAQPDQEVSVAVPRAPDVPSGQPTGTPPAQPDQLQPPDSPAPAVPQTPNPAPVAGQQSYNQSIGVSSADSLGSQTAPPDTEEEFAPQFGLQQELPEQQGTQNQGTISWTASEYIAHQKSGAWYVALGVATLVFAALVYWITGGDIISIIVIVLAAIVFGVYAGKKPKEQAYTISPSGITIGDKIYNFSQLKTFSITEEGVFSSITFWPLKRFMPALSIYYDPKDEEEIVTLLSNYLPMDVQKRDPIDSFMRKIRF